MSACGRSSGWLQKEPFPNFDLEQNKNKFNQLEDAPTLALAATNRRFFATKPIDMQLF
jgi:hypothetical protein